MFSIFGLSQNWMSLLVLLALIAAIWIFDRKNFKRDGIVFMRRTQRGLIFINDFAKKHEKFWKKFGSAGVMMSFGAVGVAYVLATQKKKYMAKAAAAFAIAFAALQFVMVPLAAAFTAFLGGSGVLIMQLVMGVADIFTKKITASPIQFVLPVQTTAAPVFYVPIDFWLISIFVIVVVHEFSHAFVSRAENIRVKSIGYGFMALIPLGFAEPDEAQLKKAESIKKTRVFAAGSLSNIITGAISALLLLLIAFIASALFLPAGVNYGSTLPGTPAYGILPPNGTITGINGNNISTTNDMAELLANISAGSKISLVVGGKDYEITTIPKDNSTKAFMGVSGLTNHLEPKKQYSNYVGDTFLGVISWLISLLQMLFMLNVGIGLVNILPIKPLDGGLIFEEISKTFWPKSWKKVYGTVALTVLGLFLLNFFGVYIMKVVSAVF